MPAKAFDYCIRLLRALSYQVFFGAAIKLFYNSKVSAR